MTSKEEKLKAQLELATGMLGAFREGGQLSIGNLNNGGVDGIGFIVSGIKDGLENLIREVAYRLQMERSFPQETKDED